MQFLPRRLSLAVALALIACAGKAETTIRYLPLPNHLKPNEEVVAYFDGVKKAIAARWHLNSVIRLHDPQDQLIGYYDRVTVVGVRLDATGALRDVQVKESSGVDFLDNYAVETVKSAQPFGTPPRALVGRENEVRFTFGFFVQRDGHEDVKQLVEAGFGANRKREYARAVDLFRKALDRAPDHPKAWGAMGWSYVQLGRADEAIAALQRQIALNPRDPFAYNNLGRAFRQTHRDADAERAFRKQLEVSLDDQYAHKNLGALLLDTGRAADAVAELERAATITPKDAEVLVLLGRARLELNEEAKALAALEEAARLSPSPNIWNNAAYALAKKGVHLDVAWQWADSAVANTSARLAALFPEHATREEVGMTHALARQWDTLGWVYFRRGELDHAACYVAAAWEINRSSVIADHLGQIREKQGRQEEAARAYALAVVAGDTAEAAAHLAAAVGGDDRARALVKAARAELAHDRVVTGFEADAGSAEFLLVVAPGRGIEAAKFEKGDEGLRKAADALRSVDDTFPFPDRRPTKLVRPARLNCSPRRECRLEVPARSDR